MRRARNLVAALCCFLATAPLFVGNVQAQNLATLQGVVADESQTPVPGATVKVTNVETGYTRNVFTDTSGLYRAPSLQPGLYSVEASLQGMQTVKKDNIKILVGQVLDVSLSMGVETMAEAITVTAEAPVVEISRSSAAKYVTEEEISNLPIAGRDFTDFALLIPTVKAEPVRGGVSLSGQRGINSGLNIDGTEAKSAFFGYGRGGEATENEGLVIAQESVKEFQVITNGFAPEYGRNGGGYINVITKNGTNDLKGGAFFFFRNDKLLADFPISELNEARGNKCQADGGTINCTPNEFKRLNWGATLGGPIIKDKTHFFVSYDHTNRDDPFIAELDKGVYDAVRIRSEADSRFATLIDGYTPNSDGTATADNRTGRTATAQFSRSVDNIVLFGKIDHQLSQNHSVSVRYNFTDYDRTSTYADEESQKLEKTHSFVGTVVSLFGNNAVNEFRIQYAVDNLDRLSVRVGEPIEAQIRIRTASFPRDGVGKFDFLPILVEESKLQIQDSFAYAFGDHDLKFGFDYSRDPLAQLFAGSLDGRYDYLTPQDFVADRSSGVRIYFGKVSFPNYDEVQSVLGFFAQDSWKPSTNLTLNLGLRFDSTFNPQGLAHIFPEGVDIPNDTNNLAPRFGFAYSLGDEGKAVVRGGAGLFYARTPSLLFASQVQQNGIRPNFGRIFVTPGQAGFVPIGTPIDNENPPTTVRPATSYVDPAFEDPGTWRVNLGYERELAPNWSTGLDLVYARGFDLASNVEINRTIASTDAFGRPIYSSTRPQAQFDEIFVRESIAESNYVAGTISVNKRFSNGYQIQAHYTYSKDKDNDDNEREATSVSVTDPDNLDYDYGVSSRDIPHRFVLSGVAELPLDFKLSGIVSLQSGAPFTAIDPANVHRFPASNGPLGGRARAVIDGQLVDRNTFRADSVKKVDLRLTKFFDVSNIRIEGFAEVFNVFNSASFTVAGTQREPTTTAGAENPEFGLNGGALVIDPRQVQLGAKITF